VFYNHTVVEETTFWKASNRHLEQFKVVPQKSTRLSAWGNHIF